MKWLFNYKIWVAIATAMALCTMTFVSIAPPFKGNTILFTTLSQIQTNGKMHYLLTLCTKVIDLLTL